MNAATSAAEGVVLPIPRSPVANKPAPASHNSSAVSIPTAIAWWAWATLIAAPSERSAVPRATRRERYPMPPGVTASRAARSAVSSGRTPAGTSPATPTSTASRPAPTCRARTLTTAPPVTTLASIWTVTSCGQAETPCPTTPWSAAKTATALGSGNGGGHVPAIPHSWLPTCSRIPIEPGGFVSVS